MIAQSHWEGRNKPRRFQPSCVQGVLLFQWERIQLKSLQGGFTGCRSIPITIIQQYLINQNVQHLQMRLCTCVCVCVCVYVCVCVFVCMWGGGVYGCTTHFFQPRFYIDNISKCGNLFTLRKAERRVQCMYAREGGGGGITRGSCARVRFVDILVIHLLIANGRVLTVLAAQATPGVYRASILIHSFRLEEIIKKPWLAFEGLKFHNITTVWREFDGFSITCCPLLKNRFQTDLCGKENV